MTDRERVLKYAREKFLDEIDQLLDDCSFLQHPDEDGATWVRSRRRLAKDVGLNFDSLISSRGTPFERERLQAVLRSLNVA